mmetsp:Transcript_37959/g.97142  ORF Transcript_37959/g.97142 Transcript_37959/m.97142 type:complete len:348 (-) Transcript_37959:226-1269(-)
MQGGGASAKAAAEPLGAAVPRLHHRLQACQQLDGFRGGGALLGVLRPELGDDLAHFGGPLGGDLHAVPARHPVGVVLHFLHCAGVRDGAEDGVAAEELVENHGQGVHVNLFVVVLSPADFRSHVHLGACLAGEVEAALRDLRVGAVQEGLRLGGAQPREADPPLLRVLPAERPELALQRGRQPEVAQLGHRLAVLFVQKHIVWLEVAVDDHGRREVQVLEPLGDVDGVCQRVHDAVPLQALHPQCHVALQQVLRAARVAELLHQEHVGQLVALLVKHVHPRLSLIRRLGWPGRLPDADEIHNVAVPQLPEQLTLRYEVIKVHLARQQVRVEPLDRHLGRLAARGVLA